MHPIILPPVMNSRAGWHCKLDIATCGIVTIIIITLICSRIPISVQLADEIKQSVTQYSSGNC